MSQEEVVLKFAKKLASNESKVRKRTIKKLGGWLGAKSKSKNGLSNDELLKIWKGLHYCMWMCDKPLVQEELADSLSRLVHVFPTIEAALQFVGVYFAMEGREWKLIDRLRISKFMMLMRKFLHQTFLALAKRDWQTDHIELLVKTLTDCGVIGCDTGLVPQGMIWHVVDIYLEELAKVGAKELTGSQTLLFLDSYCKLLAKASDKTLVTYIMENLIDDIINQTIQTHRQEESSNNSMAGDDSDEEVEMEEEETEEKEEEYKLQFDLSALADRLFELAKDKATLARNRKLIYTKVTQLKKLASGIFPREKQPEIVPSDDSISDTEIDNSAKRLIELEDGIVLGERQRKEKYKRKKKLAKSGQSMDSSDEEEPMEAEEEEPSNKKQKVAENSTATENSAATENEKKEKRKNKFKEGEEKLKAKEKKKQRQALNAERKAEKKNRKSQQQEVAAEDSGSESSGDDDDEVHIGGDSDDEAIVIENPEELDHAAIKKLLSAGKGKNTKSSQMAPIFEGGFISDSDDEVEIVSKSVKRSPKDVKRKADSKSNEKDKSSKTGKNKKESELFEGGFVSDDEDDINEPTTKNKKKKKEKKKTVAQPQNDHDLESDLNVINIDNSTSEEIVVSDTKSSPKKGKKKSKNTSLITESTDDSVDDEVVDKIVQRVSSNSKIVITPPKQKPTSLSDESSNTPPKSSSKKSKKAGGSAEETPKSEVKSPKKNKKKSPGPSTPVSVSEVTSTNTSAKKKRKKSMETENTPDNQEEEVEIYVPNKKYKGEHAEWAKQQASVSGDKENTGKSKKRRTQSESFMKFEKEAPTPPAFVRKALLKVTPKTEPRKGSKKMADTQQTPTGDGSQRRVSFGLHKNRAQSTKENAINLDSSSSDLDQHSDESEAESESEAKSESEASDESEAENENEANPTAANLNGYEPFLCSTSALARKPLSSVKGTGNRIRNVSNDCLNTDSESSDSEQEKKTLSPSINHKKKKKRGKRKGRESIDLTKLEESECSYHNSECLSPNCIGRYLVKPPAEVRDDVLLLSQAFIDQIVSNSDENETETSRFLQNETNSKAKLIRDVIDLSENSEVESYVFDSIERNKPSTSKQNVIKRTAQGGYSDVVNLIEERSRTRSKTESSPKLKSSVSVVSIYSSSTGSNRKIMSDNAIEYVENELHSKGGECSVSSGAISVDITSPTSNNSSSVIDVTSDDGITDPAYRFSSKKLSSSEAKKQSKRTKEKKDVKENESEKFDSTTIERVGVSRAVVSNLFVKNSGFNAKDDKTKNQKQNNGSKGSILDNVSVRIQKPSGSISDKHTVINNSKSTLRSSACVRIQKNSSPCKTVVNLELETESLEDKSPRGRKDSIGSSTSNTSEEALWSSFVDFIEGGKREVVPDSKTLKTKKEENILKVDVIKKETRSDHKSKTETEAKSGKKESKSKSKSEKMEKKSHKAIDSWIESDSNKRKIDSSASSTKASIENADCIPSSSPNSTYICGKKVKLLKLPGSPPGISKSVFNGPSTSFSDDDVYRLSSSPESSRISERKKQEEKPTKVSRIKMKKTPVKSETVLVKSVAKQNRDKERQKRENSEQEESGLNARCGKSSKLGQSSNDKDTNNIGKSEGILNGISHAKDKNSKLRSHCERGSTNASDKSNENSKKLKQGVRSEKGSILIATSDDANSSEAASPKVNKSRLKLDSPKVNKSRLKLDRKSSETPVFCEIESTDDRKTPNKLKIHNKKDKNVKQGESSSGEKECIGSPENSQLYKSNKSYGGSRISKRSSIDDENDENAPSSSSKDKKQNNKNKDSNCVYSFDSESQSSDLEKADGKNLSKIRVFDDPNFLCPTTSSESKSSKPPESKKFLTNSQRKSTDILCAEVNLTRRSSPRMRTKLPVASDDDSDCEIVDITMGGDLGNQRKYIRPHELSPDQYDVIRAGDWLNDIHINLAQALLKESFPQCNGLENCGLGTKKLQSFTPLADWSQKFIQVFNYSGNHWIMVTNHNAVEENEVKIYDSFYRSLKTDLKKVLINLYGSEGELTVIWPRFQLQSSTDDCGLFAIASACSILHGDDPTDLEYNQSKMRSHLMRCFQNKNLVPFPVLRKLKCDRDGGSGPKTLNAKSIGFDLETGRIVKNI